MTPNPSEETIFDRRVIPSDYDRAGINTVREEDNRRHVKAYLELF